jgi:hypothetical protein
MDFGIAETGIARGSPPGTTTEVLRVGFPSAEIRVVSAKVPECLGLKLLPLSSYNFRKKTSSPPSEAGITSARPFCLGLLHYRSFGLLDLLDVPRCHVLNFSRLSLTAFR